MLSKSFSTCASEKACKLSCFLNFPLYIYMYVCIYDADALHYSIWFDIFTSNKKLVFWYQANAYIISCLVIFLSLYNFKWMREMAKYINQASLSVATTLPLYRAGTKFESSPPPQLVHCLDSRDFLLFCMRIFFWNSSRKRFAWISQVCPSIDDGVRF